MRFQCGAPGAKERKDEQGKNVLLDVKTGAFWRFTFGRCACRDSLTSELPTLRIHVKTNIGESVPSCCVSFSTCVLYNRFVKSSGKGGREDLQSGCLCRAKDAMCLLSLWDPVVVLRTKSRVTLRRRM